MLHFFVLGVAMSAPANPGSGDPNAVFEVHGDASQQAYELCKENLAKIVPALDGFEQQKVAGRAGRVNAAQIGDVNVRILVVERAAERLKLLGETAGVDLRHRVHHQRGRLGKFLVAYYAAPEYQKALQQAVKASDKQKAARTKQIQKIRQRIDQQKWDDAERELYQLIDDFEQLAPIMGPNLAEFVRREYRQVKEQIETEMKVRRSAAAAEYLAERVKTEAGGLPALAATIDGWSRELKQKGSVDVDGTQRTGPQLVTLAAEMWEEQQARTVHQISLQWLYNENFGSSEALAPSTATRQTTTDAWGSQQVRDALVRLLEADAARANDPQIAPLHAAYVSALAPVVNRVSEGDAALFAEALQKLANRSLSVAADVDAYRQATDDLLRWRERVSAAHARSAMQRASAAPELFRKAATKQVETPGFYQPRSNDAAAISSRVPAVVTAMSDQVLQAPVYVEDVWSLGEGRPLIAGYQPDCYATATALETAAQQQMLAADLQVGPQAPPQSLRAAMAMEAARSGRYRRVGGTTSRFTVESLTTRLITIPTKPGVLFALGDLSPLNRAAVKGNVILRYDLQSQWAQNRYFFVEQN